MNTVYRPSHICAQGAPSIDQHERNTAATFRTIPAVSTTQATSPPTSPNSNMTPFKDTTPPASSRTKPCHLTLLRYFPSPSVDPASLHGPPEHTPPDVSLPPPRRCCCYCAAGAGVGWQRSCATRFLLRELDHPGTIFFSFSFHVSADGCRATVDRIVRSGHP